MKYITAALLSFFLLTTLNSYADTAVKDEDRFFYSAEIDEDMQSAVTDKTLSSEGIQYGAIISPVFLYEGFGDESLNTAVINAKIWGKSYLWNNGYIYASIRNSYMQVISSEGEAYSSTESGNTFDLDQAFISTSFSDGAFILTAGRKYFNIGTGLVLNGRGDGAELTYSGSVFSLNLLGHYTGLLIKDNNPYGLSDKDFSDGSERLFSGGVFSVALGNQNLYLFGLIQTDFSDQTTLSETAYNSQYFGAGIEGIVFEKLSYYAETVMETGTNYITNAGGNEDSSVAAYAVNTGLNYFFYSTLFSPTLTVQYAYGSGDKYRDDYTRGNRPAGSTGYDTGFISFGTYSGGYALKPLLSNIHILRAGVTIVPFKDFDSMKLKKISIGTKYSYYLKDKKDSPINDGEASLSSFNIGQEIDLSLRWQIYYDASFYVNYGLFIPGAAYDDTSLKSFVMSGVNLSF